jgi:hypothetical protein
MSLNWELFMKSKVMFRALSGALAIALGLALGGCGGGGGSSSASSPIALTGTAVAGIFKNADVKVYDATTLDMTKIATAATLVPATTTDNVTGRYSVTLPAGFNKPVLIMVSAKAAGGSSMKDEVFGETLVTDLTLCSVVPTDAISGANLTGHVTPYTNLMCEIVKNKVGKSDVNAAINQARSLVNLLNGNADPLTSDPVTDPAMVSRLAAVSNIANVPGQCAAATTNAERIKCGIDTLADAIAPMASDYDTASATPAALALDNTVRAALHSATTSLDTTVVETNTGLTGSLLEEKKTAASVALQALQGQANLTPPASAVAGGISQAKQFFANLRTGILPYTNDDQTGFLDQEGDNLQTEVNQITMASVSGLDQVGSIAEFANEMQDGMVPDGCTGNATSATCTVDGVQIAMTGSGTAWSMNNGALTGAIVFNQAGTELTMNGYVRAMTTGATKAKVGTGNPGDTNDLDTPLKMTRTAIAGQSDMYRYTLEGSLKDLNCANNVCTPVLKLVFGSDSYFNLHESDIDHDDSKLSGSFTGTFITANYRFIGQFAVSDLQAKTQMVGTAPYTWMDEEVVGGKASFTGTISGAGLTGVDSFTNNDFNLLVGKLEANINGANYNPFINDSASNFQTGSMTFTGTVFKSASDLGLKLVMTVANTGWDKGTLTVAYTDYDKGVSINGTAPFDDQSNETQYITLSDANGISVKIGDNSTTQVMKGATKLGDIENNRVTYMDGTFESLL